MDQPGLDPGEHLKALEGLERINRVSATARTLWGEIVREIAPRRRLRVLDLACGGGDVAVALWKYARRAGIDAEVLGIDINALAVRRAREKAERERAAVRFERRDVLRGELPAESDVVMNSLFLHHLDGPDAELLLRRMAASSRGLVLVDDLARGVGGYLLALAGTRLLSRSRVVHIDGPLSVRAAFTASELSGMAARAGLRRSKVRRRWPSRLMLTARPS